MWICYEGGWGKGEGRGEGGGREEEEKEVPGLSYLKQEPNRGDVGKKSAKKWLSKIDSAKKMTIIG